MPPRARCGPSRDAPVGLGWAIYLLAGALGAGGLFPLAAGHARGTAIQEGPIAGGFATVAAALIGLCALLVWGLRGSTPKDTEA